MIALLVLLKNKPPWKPRIILFLITRLKVGNISVTNKATVKGLSTVKRLPTIFTVPCNTSMALNILVVFGFCGMLTAVTRTVLFFNMSIPSAKLIKEGLVGEIVPLIIQFSISRIALLVILKKPWLRSKVTFLNVVGLSIIVSPAITIVSAFAKPGVLISHRNIHRAKKFFKLFICSAH